MFTPGTVWHLIGLEKKQQFKSSLNKCILIFEEISRGHLMDNLLEQAEHLVLCWFFVR